MNYQVGKTKSFFGKCALVAGVVAALLLGNGAWAEDGTSSHCGESGYPCTELELDAHPLSRVPTTFKFQAKISQAKLPVGDVKFPKIFVLIKDGSGAPLCEEVFENIAVFDSVLNLEIGANMACDLDEVIAKYDSLGVDVCIANKENCLKRVKLSTVPYAVKSTYAFEAGKANNANHAVECNYAHRMAADANLFDAQQIGTGFYNFHTPTDLDLLLGGLFEGQSVPDKYYRGGYVQWSPVSGDDSNLHICRMQVDANTDAPMSLEELFLHAKDAHLTGRATVWGDRTSGTIDFTVKGDARVDDALEVAGHLTVGGSDMSQDYSYADGGLDVWGPTAFHDNVVIGKTIGEGQYTTTTFEGIVDFSNAESVQGLVNNVELGSENIGAGAVTTVNIADGTIQSNDLSQEALDYISLSVTVDTNNIVDGSITSQDLSQQALGYLSDNVAINTNNIIDGTVRAEDLSADLWLNSEPELTTLLADDFASVGHDHNDVYYTKEQLKQAGGSEVHWGNLKNVPDGFADGVDNDTKYDGTNFAKSSQSCKPGTMVVGVDDQGVLHCDGPGNTAAAFDSGWFSAPVLNPFELQHDVTDPDIVFGFARVTRTEVGTNVFPIMGASRWDYSPAYVELKANSVLMNYDVRRKAGVTPGEGASSIEWHRGETRITLFNRVPDWDSGWRTCAVNQTYNFEHKLGEIPDFVFIELAENEDGTGWRVPTMSGSNNSALYWAQTNVSSLSKDKITISTGPYLSSIRSYNAINFAPTSGYFRVRAFKWTPDYDSGWVKISSSVPLMRTKVFFHNIGSLPSLVNLYVSESNDPKENEWTTIALGAHQANYTNGSSIFNITESTATVVSGTTNIAHFVNSSGTGFGPTTGYVRFKAWK